MTATVGSLLDRVHAEAWALSREFAEPGPPAYVESRARSVLVAWSAVARASVRALEATPLGESSWLSRTTSVRACLAQVIQAAPVWRASGRPGSEVPERGMVEVARGIGAIADLLSGEPRAMTEGDRAAALGVQASVLAPVHALAVASLPVLEATGGFVRECELFGRLSALTRPYAGLLAGERANRFEDLAAVPPQEVSLDAVLSRWAAATTGVLESRYGVTGTNLRAAAGDVLIVTAATSRVCVAAMEVGVVDTERGSAVLQQLADIQEAWRSSSRWPRSVRLDGARSMEQASASRALRAMVTSTLRRNEDWLPTQSLGGREEIAGLLGPLRRGMHAAGKVAVAHYLAVDRVVRGREKLWVPARSITDPSLQTPHVVEAACRRGWVAMPRGSEAGVGMLQAAKDAVGATLRALPELDRSLTVHRPTAGRPGDGLTLQAGRIVAPEHAYVVVRSPDVAGAPEQRRGRPGSDTRPSWSPTR